jgi:hypothetical protein
LFATLPPAIFTQSRAQQQTFSQNSL